MGNVLASFFYGYLPVQVLCYNISMLGEMNVSVIFSVHNKRCFLIKFVQKICLEFYLL